MSSSEADRRRIESPCVDVCMIDDASELCEGSSSPDQRREILAAIERRRVEHPELGFD